MFVILNDGEVPQPDNLGLVLPSSPPFCLLIEVQSPQQAPLVLCWRQNQRGKVISQKPHSGQSRARARTELPYLPPSWSFMSSPSKIGWKDGKRSFLLACRPRPPRKTVLLGVRRRGSKGDTIMLRVEG